jgi:hypothetical protein
MLRLAYRRCFRRPPDRRTLLGRGLFAVRKLNGLGQRCVKRASGLPPRLSNKVTAACALCNASNVEIQRLTPSFPPVFVARDNFQPEYFTVAETTYRNCRRHSLAE